MKRLLLDFERFDYFLQPLSPENPEVASYSLQKALDSSISKIFALLNEIKLRISNEK